MAHEEFIQSIAEHVLKLACRKCGEVFEVGSEPWFGNVACPKCAAAQSVPARLGHFLLLDLIGKGGMAAVFRGYDESLSRLVAIKVMRPELGEDSKFIENFLREARAAAQLNHRNIVQIYSVNAARGQPYIVMELLDAGRLDEMIAGGKPIDELRALEVAIDVAEGLQSAAGIGLVHGDIKPANILFDRNGTAKVADFGLARFQYSTRVEKGEIWGTPYYIAPEKVRGQKEDLRSDIYSLGATLYHALGGKPPFDGETATDVVLARLKGPPIRLEEIRPALNPATAKVIARMLEADPMLRYPTYASLLSDLRAAAPEVRQVAAAGPASAAGRKAARRRPRWLWPAVAAAALALAGGLAAVFWPRPPGPSPVPPPPATNAVAAASNAVAAVTNAVATNVAATGEVAVAAAPAPVQPFSNEEQKDLLLAGRHLAGGARVSAEETLLSLVKRLARDHAGRPWLAALYAVPSWLEGDSAETERRVKRLDETAYAVQSDGTMDPAAMPQSLARLMIGKSADLPPPREGAAWPEWYADLRSFFVGFDALSKGRDADLRVQWDGYLAKTNAEPAWAYALQPVARAYRDRAGQLARARSNLVARVEKGQGDAVLAELKQRLGDRAWRPFAAQLAEDAKQAERAVAAFRLKQEEAQRAAELAARQEQTQRELDALDALRDEVSPAVARKDFAAAAAAVRAPTPAPQTAQGREALRLLQEAVGELAKLKPFLAREAKLRPFPQAAAEVGGPVVGALESAVVVSIAGGAGTAEKGWDQVSPRLFAEMVAFHVAASSASEPEKAGVLLSLSVYLYHCGAVRPAAGYAAGAVQRDPSLKARARQLLPDLVPE